MKPESQNIEEKLIPYLEGVLNPKERREVEEAINGDPDLAREMSELRELILELRQGFATGLKPPQEELSAEDVVEMSLHSGPAEKLPGSSAQKARLFCSDSGLEEYSLLRALSEEMARTTLDRENVPELPDYLRQEFQKLKGAPAKGKVLPFLKPTFASKTPTVSLWKRASGWLDRVDPKPLMASAAALAMLSFGVHLYNRPASVPASTSAEVAVAPSADQKTDGLALQSPGLVNASPGIEGVAVFTSDDRGLLKEQAEKLLAKKVRYTVTKDRILVSEKDVAVAREILWEDAEGKAVAMAKEEPEPRRMARTVASAQDSDDASVSGPAEAAPFSASRDSYDSPSGAESGNVTLYNREGGRRTDAPAPIQAPRPTGGNEGRSGSKGVLSGYEPRSARAESVRPDRRGAAIQAAPEQAPSPARVVLPTVAEEAPISSGAESLPATEVTKPPMSEARRKQLKDLAVGSSRSEDTGRMDDYQPASAEPSSVMQAGAAADLSSAQQMTTMEARPRVSSPSSATVAAAPAVTRVEAEVSQLDTRLMKMQASRQTVAQRHSVELSLEKQSDKIVVYVRPSKALDKAQLDELRKALRKDLGLDEADTLIFR